MMVSCLREIIRTLRVYFDGKPEVLLSYLFGSRALGRDEEASDYDVGVLFEEPLPADRE